MDDSCARRRTRRNSSSIRFGIDIVPAASVPSNDRPPDRVRGVVPDANGAAATLRVSQRVGQRNTFGLSPRRSYCASVEPGPHDCAGSALMGRRAYGPDKGAWLWTLSERSVGKTSAPPIRSGPSGRWSSGRSRGPEATDGMARSVHRRRRWFRGAGSCRPAVGQPQRRAGQADLQVPGAFGIDARVRRVPMTLDAASDAHGRTPTWSHAHRVRAGRLRNAVSAVWTRTTGRWLHPVVGHRIPRALPEHRYLGNSASE